MHKHNLDKIAELAHGTLTDESNAATLVESCEICRSEYENQKEMMALLGAIPAAQMSDHEKAALHRDLWTELRATESGSTAKAGPPWWRAWAFGAAALLFVGIGLTGVLNNMGGSGADSAEIAADTTSPQAGFANDDAGGDGAAIEESAPTSAAAAGARTELTTAEFKSIARSVRDSQISAYDQSESDTESPTDCLDEAGLAGHRVVPGFEEETDLLVVVPAAPKRSDFVVTFLDPTNCEIVHVEE